MSDSIATVTKLKDDELISFMNVISLISKSCNDITFEDGHIRQLGGNRNSIFDIDLSSEDALGQSFNFSLTKLQQKEKLLSIICKLSKEMDIIVDNELIIFKDKYSIIQARSPIHEFLEHKYISPEELQSSLSLTGDECIVKYTVTRDMIDRIRGMSDALGSVGIMIEFLDEEIKFKMNSSESQATTYVDVISIPIEEKIFDNKYCIFSTDPFLIDTQQLELEFWATNLPEEIRIKTKCSIGKTKLIPITIWSRTTLNDID